VLFLEALGAAHGPEPAVEEDHRLVPEASVREAVDWMRERCRVVASRPERPVGSSVPLLLFVSHEPLLSGVATRLLGRRRASFERAELVVLAPSTEGDPASGTWQEICRILPQ
jgi:phosphohistidine phosphatase SixA